MFGDQQSKQEQPRQGPKPPSSRHALGVAIAASVGAAGLFAAVVLVLPSPATKDEGDLFSAKVLVLGAYDYDTQIGSSTTVPSFSVVSISVIGHQD